MTAILELALSTLLSSRRAHDAGLVTRNEPVSSAPKNITVTCPIGPASADTTIPRAYVAPNTDVPPLSWSAEPAVLERTKEWLLVSEDPDAPLAKPIVHGLYLGIPPQKTAVEKEDFETVEGERGKVTGEFWYGRNRRRNVYIPPKPLIGHGRHPYIFSVIALSEPLERKLVESVPGVGEVVKAMEGKVIGWGEWFGGCERKWSDS